LFVSDVEFEFSQIQVIAIPRNPVNTVPVERATSVDVFMTAVCSCRWRCKKYNRGNARLDGQLIDVLKSVDDSPESSPQCLSRVKINRLILSWWIIVVPPRRFGPLQLPSLLISPVSRLISIV
jgi:hypothetical protein